MFIFNHTNSLTRVIRGFVRFALCSLILSSSFHLEGHNHSNEDGYNMCRIDCESCEPHARHGSCEECVINRNQESFLFGVAYYFRGREDRKASYITHNNKLEFFWTAIPAVILLVLISYGLNVWGKIVNQDIEDAIVIEVYAKQFGWSARYAGEDNKLGNANVRYVGGKNELGVISESTKNTQISSIDEKISKLENEIKNSTNPAEQKLKSQRIEKLNKKRKTLMTYYITTSEDQLLAANDDFVVKELHLPVGKKVLFKFRSQDVIHSAYLPHFRVQMNCVPGTTTQFAFTPTITSENMKKEVENDLFEYVLLCNKICGNAHYNMQMKVIVETEEEFNAWLKEQSVNKIANL